MMEYDPNEEVADEIETVSPIQIDTYGVRVKINPPKTLDDGPLTWAAVWHDAEQSFMRICRDLPGLAADTCTGARDLIRGICIFPSAIIRRIVGGQDRAAKREELASANAPCITDQHAAAAAVRHAKDLFADLNAKGIATNMSISPSGTVLISVSRPELQDAAHDAAIEVTAAIGVNEASDSKEGTEASFPFGMPVFDLKISPETILHLRKLGFDYVDQVLDAPRPLLNSILSANQLAELKAVFQRMNLQARAFPAFDEVARIPLTEFELSRHARAVLDELGIRTVGRLTIEISDNALAQKIDDDIWRELLSVLQQVGITLTSQE